MKAAALDSVPFITALVCVSVHDTKPVHVLSMRCLAMAWISKHGKVFDKEFRCYQCADFLRLNVNESCNNKMNDVDVADQLRNDHRLDHWMRKAKWWGAVFSGDLVSQLLMFTLLTRTSLSPRAGNLCRTASFAGQSFFQSWTPRHT